jgi:elongation factor P
LQSGKESYGIFVTNGEIAMKEVQDLRAGNTVKVGNDLFLVLKAVYNKGARGASSVKMKLKNLATNATSETVYRAGDKFNDIILERRPMQYLYESGDLYTFMDQNNFEQIELNKDDLGDALNYLKEQMVIMVVMHESKAVGVELPINVDLKIVYTEPAVKGDTSGKVLKTAKIETGYEVQVPLYCKEGELIRIDTRTGEFVARA